MDLQPHFHCSHDFPLCANGFYSCGFDELQQPQHAQYHQQQQPQYQQPTPQHQHEWQFHIPFHNPHVHASNFLSSPTLDALLEKQRHETYQFINIQKNNQNKLMLKHQRELQAVAIKNMEIYFQQMMTIKNEEIAKVAMKKQEMENLIGILEKEKMEMKRIAEEKGAVVIALYNMLEEEKKRLRMLVENDEESCCGENDEVRAKKRVRHGNNIAGENDEPIGYCHKCSTNYSRVLFLPCRHISSCKTCESLLQTCPICGMAKNGVIEIQI